MSSSTTYAQGRGALHLAITCVLAVGASAANAANTITVHDTGAAGANTCNLAQAINAANGSSNISIFSYGSQAASAAGNCQVVADAIDPNNYDISFDPALPPTIVLAGIDNYWYGPNALPPIATAIHIIGADAGTTLQAVHTGDPTPAAANAFRFFYVAGGIDGEIRDNALQPATGTLTLENIVLQGGYAKGGNSRYGGGGAGMGGAIFNQGFVKLISVSLIGNVAQGGGWDPLGPDTLYAGGGMGEDAHAGGLGGGFGGPIGGQYGGAGAIGFGPPKGGGGGGGFLVATDGSSSSFTGGGQGGGGGKTGGPGGYGSSGSFGGAAGDGGSGGGAGTVSGAGGGGGGGFGGGGGAGYGRNNSASGGGGVGGGGGSYYGGPSDQTGDGGRFGVGGVGSFGTGSATLSGGGFGGFGGGGGGGGNVATYGAGGFGGGRGNFDANFGGGGGAGMGGAIFNHRGSLSLLNVTAAQNLARSGAGYGDGLYGSGLGAVIFNLNGDVLIEYSTMAVNTTSGSNGSAASAEDGTIYSLAYNNTIEDGSPSTASLAIHASIIRGPQHGGGPGNAVVANRVDGDSANTSTVKYWVTNFIASSSTIGNATTGGTGTASAADPLLLSLTRFGYPNVPLPVFPFRSGSPARDAVPTCRRIDSSGNLVSGTTGKVTGDARGVSRPSICDVGSYEFDNDEIFPDDFEGSL